LCHIWQVSHSQLALVRRKSRMSIDTNLTEVITTEWRVPISLACISACSLGLSNWSRSRVLIGWLFDHIAG
jgi:hypothetical protein